MRVWNTDRNDPCVASCPKCGVSPVVLFRVVKEFHLVKCPECWKKSTIEKDRGDAVAAWNFMSKRAEV